MVQICWHYNVFNDTNTSSCIGPFEKCAQKVECKPEGGGNMSCFALADIISNQREGDNGTQKILAAAGCYENSGVPGCDPECLGSQRPQNNNRYFCCCTSEGCNNNIIIPKNNPNPAPPQPSQNSTSTPAPTSNTNSSYTLPVILLVLMSVAILPIVATYLRRRKSKRNNNGRSRSPHDGSLASSDNHRHELHDIREALAPLRSDEQFLYGQIETHHDNDFTNYATRHENIDANKDVQQEEIDLKSVELLDVVGSGRFGTVHKANIMKDGACEIAVKIIPNNELQSWQNELDIYRSPRTRHPNILKFLGYTVSPDTNSHWLLVEYASNGSLHHYLKENIVSWPDLISISLGIVRGLSHLHDGDIAHRDFKSKNVLLRNNLSPCITDFGVATILDIGASGSHHEHSRRKYLQVGTPRYMAPEVLDCAVAFTKISFTKIDVYALSLVIWELLSRCYPLPKPWGTNLDDSTLSDNVSRQVRSSSPRNSSGGDVIDGAPSSANTSANGFETSIDLSDIAPPVHHKRPPVPLYKMPFEDEVGSNPDIDTMRQAIMVDKLRPPIRSEWRFYPVSKVAQVIVDGWEYDQDARISASCFVERIESLKQQQEQMYQNRIRRAQLAANSSQQQANCDYNPDGQQRQPEPPPGPPELSVTAMVA